MRSLYQAIIGTMIAAMASGAGFQNARNDLAKGVPEFGDFAVTAGAIFRGTPAVPRLRTPGQRRYRTMIRQAAAKGPNFAGRYRIAEWGCGTACEQMAIIDTQYGDVFDGPFGILPEAIVDLGPSVERDKTGLFYRLNSSLFIVAGCPGRKKCGSYYYRWTGTQFILLRQIPMKPLYGSAD